LKRPRGLIRRNNGPQTLDGFQHPRRPRCHDFVMRRACATLTIIDSFARALGSVA
jgi:hypothetical protein